MTKNCPSCGLTKPLETFGPDSRTKTGRRTYCRECVAAKKRAADAKKPERVARLTEASRREREGVKMCRKCQTDRPLDKFGRCAESPDGLDPRCRDCKNADAREFYARNLERERERSREAARRRWEAKADDLVAYHRNWRAENRERVREARLARNQGDPNREREKFLRRRALKAGAVVSKADLDALWTGRCALCESSIDRNLAWPHPDSPSVDHIVPLSRGGTHEQSNLQWTHLFCNLSKGATVAGEAS